MASEETKVETKITQMKLAAERTGKILDASKQGAIERHLKALQAIISETDHCKRTVEAKKIGDKQDLTEIGDWNAETETKIGKAEDEVNRLQQWFDGKRMEEENYAREEKLKFEVKLEETKLQMHAKAQHENPGGHGASETITGEDTKGTSVRFWGQFTETVDKSNIAAINKFTYLCEFLSPKVKRRVESLPFTAEGYH